MENQLIGTSVFWEPLWRCYGRAAPSMALCRVPELELASTLPLVGSTLDHCCGDGFFASLGWPGSKFSAGCDISAKSLEIAAKQQGHERLDACDAGKRLPYEDRSFDLVFNNSAFEHIPDLDRSLSEVARVTKPGGTLAFNILNDKFYYDWWPLGKPAMDAYCGWQPVYHILSLDQWRARLAACGFEIQQVNGYFGPKATKVLARLDYQFSGFYLSRRLSMSVIAYKMTFGVYASIWRQRLAKLGWRADTEASAGYFIVAKRSEGLI